MNKLDCSQDIIKGPARPAGNNLCPDFFWDGVARVQKAPVGTRLRFDPFEILHLAPPVLVIGAVMIESLGRKAG